MSEKLVFLKSKIKFTKDICSQKSLAANLNVSSVLTAFITKWSYLKNHDEKDIVQRVSMTRIKYAQPKPLELISKAYKTYLQDTLMPWGVKSDNILIWGLHFKVKIKVSVINHN